MEIVMTSIQQQFTYLVPGMSCHHCRAVITTEVEEVPGVASVHVDLDARRVVVVGQGVKEGAVRAAMDEASYEIAEVSQERP